MKRMVLGEMQWEWVLNQLHGNIRTRAEKRPEHYRRFVEAVLWVSIKNLPWDALTKGDESWRATYIRFLRWEKAGIWDVLADDNGTRLGTEISTALSRRLLLCRWRKEISSNQSRLMEAEMHS